MKNLKNIAAFVVLLSSCASNNPSYRPFLLAKLSVFEAETEELRETLMSRTGGERIYLAMTIIDARCDRFFEDLEKLRASTRFAGRQVSALETGLPTLLQAAEASSLSVAAVSAALGFIGGTLADYDELYLLANFKNAAHKKWLEVKTEKERILYQIAEEVDNKGKYSTEYINREIYKYSRTCLHSQLITWIEQSAESGKAKKVVSEEGGEPEVLIFKQSEPAQSKRIPEFEY